MIMLSIYSLAVLEEFYVSDPAGWLSHSVGILQATEDC